MGTYKISRERMVREQIAGRGIVDPLVLAAMSKVPRHLFVPEALAAQSYADYPLPIGFGQTISQPYIVALMSQMLQVEAGMKVLEIGTGSGYQAAVLHCMELEVHTVERLRELYTQAGNLFLQLRYRGIRLKLADGTQGWEDAAPFDRIIVTAGGPEVPAPLLAQLADPGIMVIPVGGERRGQQLVRVVKNNGCVTQEATEMTSFVDLIGRHGW